MMKNTILIIIALIFVSCSLKTKNETKYRYGVSTSHDNNWTTSGRYLCDSIHFQSQTEAIIFIDGREQKIFAPLIKVYDSEIESL